METLLRRTDTFDPVCFLYASLSRISKAETVKMTQLQTENFFHLAYTDTNKSFRNLRETEN